MLRSVKDLGLFRGAVAVALGSALVACCATAPPATPAKGDPAAVPAAAENEVVRYLKGAERQSETADQEREIRRALEDLASLLPSDLRKKRYADYSMQPGQWTLATLLHKYFVPAEHRTIDEERLYQDAQRPEARAVVKAHIQAIDENRQAAP